MKNSTVIATCLLNSRTVTRLEDGELLVQEVFEREFPTEDFNQWNSEINDNTAKNLIQNVEQVIGINVKQLIDDLRAIS